MLGNGIEWWAVSAFIAVFVGICAAELIAWQLGKPILQDDHVFNFHIQVVHYLLGFLVHIGPSFLMKRQMFLHHYLPAYYFGILAFGHALDIIVSFCFARKKIVGNLLIVTFFVGCLYFFNSYKPLIYGLPWTIPLCEKSQWLTGWDYHCGSFLETYEEYDNETIVSKFDIDNNGTEMPMATTTDLLEVDEIEEPVIIDEVVEDIPLEANEEDLVVEETSERAVEPPKKEESIDDIANKEGFSRFLDENGNEIPIEEVKRIMAEQGGALKIEEKIVEV